MVETKKIQKVSFSNTWNAPDGPIHYFQVLFENEQYPYTIGSKSVQPDFLKEGAELMYQIKDASKRTIVRFIPKEEPSKIFSGNPNTPAKAFSGGSDASTGMMVGNAITNAVSLIVAGKITLEEFESVAETICEISNRLKQKFSK